VRARNVTVVWIEHVLNAILAVADRILVLNFGEKIAEGESQAVCSAIRKSVESIWGSRRDGERDK
jgi:ABC-type branched-subunit amino acid transport system ATPase component